MKAFVEMFKNRRQTPVYVSQGGSYDTPVPLKVQMKLMLAHPEGTEFAVYGSLSPLGFGAHWNYAIRTKNGIEFRDYQYNISEQDPAKVADAFIPPKGNEKEKYELGIVLVFRDKKIKMSYE